MRLFFLLSVSFLVSSAYCQKTDSHLADSLLAGLPENEHDTLRIGAFIAISNAADDISIEDRLQYAQKALRLSRDIQWDKGVAASLASAGVIYREKSNYTQAISALDSAYELYKRVGYRRGMGKVLTDIGGSYHHRGNYTDASKYYFLSLQLIDSVKDADLAAQNYSDIAALYFLQDNFEKSLEYSSRAAGIMKKLNDIKGVAGEYEARANVYNARGDKKTAVDFYLNALAIYQETGDMEGVATQYSQLGTAYYPDYFKSLSYYLKGQKIWDSINLRHYTSIINIGNIGCAYLDIARYDTLHIIKPGGIIPEGRAALLSNAELYLRKAIRLSREVNDKVNGNYFTGVLAEAQSEKGDYKNAYINFRAYQEGVDSIYSQENKNKIAGIESQRALAIRDKEIELNRLALSAQKKQRFALVSVIGLLAVIGVLLLRQSRIRKKTNSALVQLNRELDDANKVKARFFAILSHDFRAPLSRLVHFLHLQKEDAVVWSSEEAAEHERKITDSAESLLENMEAMLTWSKGQMENFKPQVQIVNVSDLFDYIRHFFVTSDHVQLVFDDPGDIQVNTDENYLQTIMHNLTSNAIKALKNTDQAKITWSARKEGAKIIFSVADNGPGVLPDQIKILQDEASVLTIKSGLGFHLIRDLAKAIHCSISVVSASGQGACFTLSILS